MSLNHNKYNIPLLLLENFYSASIEKQTCFLSQRRLSYSGESRSMQILSSSVAGLCLDCSVSFAEVTFHCLLINERASQYICQNLDSTLQTWESELLVSFGKAYGNRISVLLAYINRCQWKTTMLSPLSEVFPNFWNLAVGNWGFNSCLSDKREKETKLREGKDSC